MRRPRVYCASKVRHRDMWLDFRERGFHFCSSWLDLKEEPLDRHWERFVSEARHCDLLILYCEPGELLKGALIEAGAALGGGSPVYLYGTCDSVGSWDAHPLVRRLPGAVDPWQCTYDAIVRGLDLGGGGNGRP